MNFSPFFKKMFLDKIFQGNKLKTNDDIFAVETLKNNTFIFF